MINSKAYTATVTDFRDFTGIQTAVGSLLAFIIFLGVAASITAKKNQR